VGAVTHHVEEEESEILPALRDALDAGRLEELGEAFERRRIEELAEFGIEENKYGLEPVGRPAADQP
jgi:hypothetical protein